MAVYATSSLSFSMTHSIATIRSLSVTSKLNSKATRIDSNLEYTGSSHIRLSSNLLAWYINLRIHPTVKQVYSIRATIELTNKNNLIFLMFLIMQFANNALKSWSEKRQDKVQSWILIHRCLELQYLMSWWVMM